MIHLTQSSLNQIIEIFNKRKTAIGLSKYFVGDFLDQGGMSNVYRVIDTAKNTDYVFRISEERKSSYSNDIFNVREMEILRELKKNSQPHVVQYLDAFVVDIPGQPRYYCSVMKYLCTLKHYHLNGDGVEIAVRLGCDFLPLLQSFMEKAILHRDIKPENIFFDGDFRNDTGFLLGDFGIAKRDTNISVTPTGTESTMAPEVRGLDRSLGRDRAYSDMYSLGVVMYRYLNEGVYPSNLERIEKVPPDKKPFPEPRYGSKRLKEVVLRATSYDPRDRYDSPQAMLRELQQCEEYSIYLIHRFDKLGDSVDVSKYIEEENERLHKELAEREKERRAHQVNLNRLKLRIHRLNDEKKSSEQQAEQLKQQSDEQEEALQTEIDQLKQQAAQREEALQAEMEQLKQQAAQREQVLQAEMEQLKQQAAQREQALQAEIEQIRHQAIECVQALQTEMEQLKQQAAQREQALQIETALNIWEQVDSQVAQRKQELQMELEKRRQQIGDDFLSDEDEESYVDEDEESYVDEDDGSYVDEDDESYVDEDTDEDDESYTDEDDESIETAFQIMNQIKMQASNRKREHNAEFEKYHEQTADDFSDGTDNQSYEDEESYVDDRKEKHYSRTRIIRLISLIVFSIGLVIILFFVFPFANEPSAFTDLKVGDRFTFGNYKQGAHDEVQPIEWRVLAVKDNNALVVSEKLLDYVEYHENNTNTTWEESSLRQWMNSDFYSTAFSADERAKILKTVNLNTANPEYGTDGGNQTTDTIFALSIEEADKYFTSGNDRIALTTEFAHAKGHDTSFRADWWWLRTPGYKNDFAACVNIAGDINKNGNHVEYLSIAVRPAFWLNLE